MDEAGSPLSTEESGAGCDLEDDLPVDGATLRRIQHVSAISLGNVAPLLIHTGAER